MGRPKPSPSLHKTLFLFLEGERERRESILSSLLSCERPYLVSKGFSCYTPRWERPASYVSYHFFTSKGGVLLMMLRTAVRSARRGKLGQNMTPEGPGAHNPILSESEFTVPPALMLRDRNILLPSTAVTPEIKGSTRAPVLRRGGRTDKGIGSGCR